MNGVFQALIIQEMLMWQSQTPNWKRNFLFFGGATINWQFMGWREMSFTSTEIWGFIRSWVRDLETDQHSLRWFIFLLRVLIYSVPQTALHASFWLIHLKYTHENKRKMSPFWWLYMVAVMWKNRKQSPNIFQLKITLC